MQIGLNAPTSGPLIEPDSLVQIVTEAEELGFDYLTISDHIMVPRNLDSKYPYTDSGEFPAGTAAAWSLPKAHQSRSRPRRSLTPARSSSRCLMGRQFPSERPSRRSFQRRELTQWFPTSWQQGARRSKQADTASIEPDRGLSRLRSKERRQAALGTAKRPTLAMRRVEASDV